MQFKKNFLGVGQKIVPAFSISAAVTAGLLAVMPARAAELNIYSHRQPFLINPFLEVYSKKTGTKVNIVYSTQGLAERLKSEGERSPADVVLTVDIGRIKAYADLDLLAPVESEVLVEKIPENMRDPNKRWFALSVRARVFAISKKAKDAGELKRYEDIVKPIWKGRVCSRPGSHVYNRALLASMINTHGEAKAKEWAEGVVANLARRPQGNDRAQVKGIYEGVCDVAIINSYYFGALKNSKNPEQPKWAEAVTLIFPNQEDRGTHVNISAGGVAKYSKSKAEAQRFLEWLTSDEAQKLYLKINSEYSINASFELPPHLVPFGVFKRDKVSIAKIGNLTPAAQRIVETVGW